MSPDIRRRALRAVAKTALVMTIGCSGSSKKVPTSIEGGGGAGTAAAEPTCAAYLDGLATAQPDQLAADDPLKDKPGVYGAFADVKARAAAKTQTCCDEELARDESAAAHRWACCSAVEGTAGAPENLGVACTPWGPPCPPAMA